MLLSQGLFPANSAWQWRSRHRIKHWLRLVGMGAPIRNEGTVAEDFVPGQVATFRKADAIEARQFGELSSRICLKPLGRARYGPPDQLLAASTQIATLMRKCRFVQHILGPWVRRLLHRRDTVA